MTLSEAHSLLPSLAGLLSKQVTTDRLLRLIIDQVTTELDAERGTLWLVDARTGELVSLIAHLPELDEIRLPRGQGIAGHVAETGESVTVPDVSSDKRFFPGVDKTTGYKTNNMLAVPIRDAEGAIQGVLQVLNRRSGDFGEGDKRRLLSLADQVAQALELTSLRPHGESPRGLMLDGVFNHVIGDSPQMKELYVRILAASSTDVTVLIRGESGTGKTLVARAIHDNSDRRNGPLVHVDCTTLPAGLIENELFGHERGAFTGAECRVLGKVEQADHGTLFLDEIGDLPINLQGKLLHFIQEHSFQRLGGQKTLQADVRLISATNARLEERIASGNFRQDLYYRLRVFELTLPSLRERGPRDIERLALHFLDLYSRRYRRKVNKLCPEALDRLNHYDWPGNVRELEHCIESAVVLAHDGFIRDDQLSLPTGSAQRVPPTAGYPPGTPLSEVERDHLRRTLEFFHGNQTEAARALGIGRNTLARKLHQGSG